MKVLQEFGTSHHYFSNYKIDPKIFCPNCGGKPVWVAASGDYYEGPDHVCVTCKTIFTMPGNKKAEQDYELMTIEQLKTGITLTPKTPRGN